MRKNAILYSTLTALTMCAAWAGAANAAETAAKDADLPIKRVTLYTSGVGYFERTGAVSGDATETLLFPVGQVNDVLKSLVLLDYGGGGIQPVTYGAQDPLNKQLQAFSIDLSDNPDMGTLLNRLRGAKVVLTLPASATYTGVVVGVEQHTVTRSGGSTTEQVLNIMGEDGLHAIKLAEITALKLADPKLDSEMREALSTIAQGRDTTKRPIRLSFHGSGKRDVLVGYLTEAPLWQSTYRLVLGEKPLLQGWALVQNTSQDDWDGVDLSLVSGRPISFTQDLYTPLYVRRPEVKPQLQVAAGPVTYGSDIADAPKPTEADDTRTVVKSVKVPAHSITAHQGGPGGYPGSYIAGASAESVEVTDGYRPSTLPSALSQSIGTHGAQLGQSLFSYNIKTPVSVPRQQSAMIPFVSAGVTAEPVSIYNSSVNADHPLTGTRIVNNTALHLMGGPITVFDASDTGNGYVGDALIDDTEPGQKRLISYAVDVAIDAAVEPSGEDNGQIVSIIINQGVLVVTNKTRASTKYTFKNHGQKARVVVVEDTYRGDSWHLLAPDKAREHTKDVDRFDVPVTAGASKIFVVTRENTEDEEVGLIDCDLETLVEYRQSGKISADMRAALQEIIRRRQAIDHIDKQIGNRKSELNGLAQGQQRIRDNMKALDHSSNLYKRYIGELDAQETKLQSLQNQITQLQSDHERAQNDLSNYVSKLTAK